MIFQAVGLSEIVECFFEVLMTVMVHPDENWVQVQYLISSFRFLFITTKAVEQDSKTVVWGDVLPIQRMRNTQNRKMRTSRKGQTTHLL